MEGHVERVQIGVVGCGAISAAYFDGAKSFPILKMTACADLDADRARSVAQKYGLRAARSVDELLADPAIDIVLNLTIPAAHVEIGLCALAAGKHTYCEKP